MLGRKRKAPGGAPISVTCDEQDHSTDGADGDALMEPDVRVWHPVDDGYEDAVIDVLDSSDAVALRIPCHRSVVCWALPVLRDQDRQTDSVVEGRKRLVMADDPEDVRRMVAELYRLAQQCSDNGTDVASLFDKVRTTRHFFLKMKAIQRSKQRHSSEYAC